MISNRALSTPLPALHTERVTAGQSPPGSREPDAPASPRNFDTLYRATLLPLRRYLSRLLGDPSEAQDVAHDAYLRLYPRNALQQARRPEALLFTTARRLALNRLKRRRIAPFAPGALDPETTASATPGVVQQLMERQELDRLEAAIAELPPGCRTVLLLRTVGRLSHREIAERLGIAVSTVEKQHARALRMLRIALTPPGQPAAASNSQELPNANGL